MHLLALVLLSQTFAAGATVPQTMVAVQCGGSGISPQLTWHGAPRGTRSYALILHDPDAPVAGGFFHWVLYDMPASTTTLAAGESLPASTSGRNGTGSIGYFGPCPPPGKLHHYNFTLYALDVAAFHPSEPLSAAELLLRMHGHILAQATETGTLQR